MEQIVTNNTQIKSQCDKLVTELIACRKLSQTTQESMADWLGVSRKKLSEFESGNFDFDLAMQYADKMSIDVKLNFDLN